MFNNLVEVPPTVERRSFALHSLAEEDDDSSGILFTAAPNDPLDTNSLQVRCTANDA